MSLFRSARPLFRGRTILSLAMLPALFSTSPSALRAQGTKEWTQSHYDEFEKGTPRGVAISSEGYLQAGPSLKELAATGSTYVWSISADREGNVYAATGSPARVVKVSADGKQSKLFESKDLSVQVVRVGPDGSIYAATLPSGKVYRLKPGQTDLDDSKAEVAFDPATVEAKADSRPKYIWDMAFDANGGLYIATGAPAAVYRVATAGARPQKFFTSDEQHIRCLLFEKDGSLIAGTDNGGLVYRIDREGKGRVIYDAPKAEITALAESTDGMLYVSAVGEKNKNNLPPLPVQGNVGVTITVVQPGSIQVSTSNGLIPEGSEVDEINRQGAPRKLWATRDDVVYALASTPSGLLVATGNRGHVYRVEEDASFADLAHAEASQVTAIAPAANGFYLGASNGGKVYALKTDPAAESSYESQVFDAGFFSQVGLPEIDVAAGTNYELSVRTGNIDNPVRGWSDWQPVTAGMKIPSGRFLQWKAVLHEGPGRLNSVGLFYLPVNVAPAVDEVMVVPGARANPQGTMQPGPQQIQIAFPSAQQNNYVGLASDSAASPLSAYKDKAAVTVRWSAHDDNGDDLSFKIYVRGEGEQDWLLLKDRTRERYLSFDAIHLPDGIYRIKVVASDQPSHPEGQSKTGDRISDRFTIDTTPPAISALAAQMKGTKLRVTLNAKDATSTIEHAEYSVDAGRWQYLEPVSTLSDAKEEHYDFSAAIPSPDAADADPSDADSSNEEAGAAEASMKSSGRPSEHVVTVRVYDRYGNVAAAKAVVH